MRHLHPWNLFGRATLAALPFWAAFSAFAQSASPPLPPSLDPPSMVVVEPARKFALAIEPPLASYSHGDPTAEEQYMLELVNRARANPAMEGLRLQATTDPNVLSAYSFFQVNVAQMAAAFAGYPPRPPLAFNASLIASARSHSQDMADHDFQGHVGSDGSSFTDRITSAGYTGWNAAAENAYAYADSVFYAHAGFNVDWGVPSLGHRMNLMNFDAVGPVYAEIGIGIVSEMSPATAVGPLVVTQDFGRRSGQLFVVGVIYQDKDKDGFYSIGEGIGGIAVTTSQGNSAVTSSSGGYAIPLPGSSGSITVRAEGAALGVAQEVSVALAGANVKVDFLAGASSASEADVISNPYGALTLLNGTLNGNSITALKPGAVIQLGTTPGSAGSFAEIDFHGLSIAAGDTLTVKSGAPGQSIMLVNVDAGASSIAGALVASGGNGAAAPVVSLQNPNGITVELSGNIIAPAGLLLDTLGNTSTIGQPLVNNGVLDGGSSLQLFAAKVTGGGSYKGNAVVVSTFGHANNPVNGAHFLSNGLQLFPSSGSTVALTLNGYGSMPQALNLRVNGNATVQMPSAWPAGSSLPANNRPVPPGGSVPPGTPAPGFGGGSMIVQATGTLTLVNNGTDDFVFPGAIVLKSTGDLDVNGVVVNNSWTGAGQSFQGVFFESPNIVSTPGLIQVLTNNLNWVNFSTLPHAPVRTWQLVPAGNGSLSHLAADSIAPHRNTYSILIEAAAAGQCWVCLVNGAPINVQ